MKIPLFLVFAPLLLTGFAADSPVVPLPLGEATKISVNNYYEILKTQVGNLQSEEYLQLKLVADPIDVNDENYRYWSHYNLLRRSDVAIEPQPISASILTSSAELNKVYGRFLQRLRSFVVRKSLNAEEQLRLADIDAQIERTREMRREFEKKEIAGWREHCSTFGTPLGDLNAYVQWSANSGYQRELDEADFKLKTLFFDKKSILNREYADPEDREIILAEAAYDEPRMRLRYPINPDYNYSGYKDWTLTYLATLPDASTGLFQSRRAITWNVALSSLPTLTAGAFTSEFGRSTSESSAIATDWKTSARVSYAFISAKASASEQKQITEDFKKATSLKLSAKAAYKVGIIYPDWFQPQLFEHKHVKANKRDFVEFFGPTGSLLYHPVSLVLVRGFSATFESTQAWTYDYDKKFSASAGGGFSVFGISFGGDHSYGEHIQKHKVDKANTSLTFADGESTLRFVGYVVKRAKVASTYEPLELPITEPGEEAEALNIALQ